MACTYFLHKGSKGKLTVFIFPSISEFRTFEPHSKNLRNYRVVGLVLSSLMISENRV